MDKLSIYWGKRQINVNVKKTSEGIELTTSGFDQLLRMLYRRSYETRREQALGDYGGLCHTVGASGTTLYSYNEHLSRHGSSETQAEGR